MTEAFLHYVWQFQFFNKTNLQTATHEPLNILKVGYPNKQDGADFQQAQIKIGEMLWVGSIEIHLTDSAWQQHRHQADPHYNNVILHVVWQQTSQQPIKRADGSEIPTFVLEGRVSPLLLEKYNSFLKNNALVPCEKDFRKVDRLTLVSMLDNVLVQRLQRKAEKVLDLLQANTGNWEETTYQWIAQSFGFKVNNTAFLTLAQHTPWQLIQKYRFDLTELEALLFGQAGFLDAYQDDLDDYVKNLQIKYNYLKHKHQLVPMSVQEWKFLRLRPANFPPVRLAQFAALLHQQTHLFTPLLNIETYKELTKLLQITSSDYWQTHYHLGKLTTKNYSHLGTDSANNLIINTVAPLLAAYSMQTDNDVFTTKAIRFFEQLPAENNQITRTWEEVGLPVKTAFDSQASIELYQSFCTPKKCLQCRVGKEILGREAKK